LSQRRIGRFGHSNSINGVAQDVKAIERAIMKV